MFILVLHQVVFLFDMFNLLKLIKQIKRQFIFKRLENDRLYWVSLLLHLSLYTFSPARIDLIFHGTLVFIIENSPLSKCKMDDNKCKKNLSQISQQHSLKKTVYMHQENFLQKNANTIKKFHLKVDMIIFHNASTYLAYFGLISNLTLDNYTSVMYAQFIRSW